MTVFDRIKEICDIKGISINDLEKQLGYSKNTLYRLKKNMPGSEKLAEIAKYLNVSTDYLLGIETNKEIIDLSEDDAVFAFDGKPVSKEEREMLAAVIAAHRANKNS